MPGSLEKQIKDMMKFLIFIILFLPSLCLAQRYPPVGGVPAYADQAALPSFSTNGALAITVDTYTLWAFDINSLSWLPIAGASSISSIGTIDSQVASVNGGVATGGALYFQSASSVDPGLVNTSSQTFAGAKTFNSAPNFFSLTASTALELDGSKNLASSSTTSTELGYVHGVTSAIQTQLNALQPALTFTAPLVDTTNTVTCNVASGSQPGCLASADWTTFNNKQAALTFSAPLVNTANTVTCNAASGSQAGCLASADWTTFNNKSPAGNYATSGSGDVSWSAPSGPGAVTTSLVATTNSSLTTLSGLTTAGSLSTVGTIGTGVWQGTQIAIANGGTNASSAAAGTIPNATTTTAASWTATPTLGVAGTTSGTFALASSTSSTGLVTLANQGTTSGNAYTFSFPLTGGTNGYGLTTNGSGTTTWTAVATNPATAAYDTIYQNTGNTALTNLANGTTGQVYMATTSGAPSWAGVPGNSTILKAVTVQNFTSTGSTTAYAFTTSSATVASSCVFTNNGHTFTAAGSITSGTLLIMTGTGAPASSGTLTYSSGAGCNGSSNLAFSAEQTMGTYTLPTSPSPLWIELKGCAGGGGGAGSGTTGEGSGIAGLQTLFGTNLIVANGAAGGGVFGGVNYGGAGGTASLGTGPIGIAITGATGGSGYEATSSAQGAVGGQGGSTMWGGGGGGSWGTATGIAGATNTGSGGGGAGTGLVSADTPGNGGGAGGCFDAIITSPASTYFYAVGTGGAGGTAGSSGNIGGAGAAGQIEVIEHYQ